MQALMNLVDRGTSVVVMYSGRSWQGVCEYYTAVIGEPVAPPLRLVHWQSALAQGFFVVRQEVDI